MRVTYAVITPERRLSVRGDAIETFEVRTCSALPLNNEIGDMRIFWWTRYQPLEKHRIISFHT